MRGAAFAGAVATLLWLRAEQQCEYPAAISLYAAMGGSVDVLRLLKQERVPFSDDCCQHAIRPKQLSALQFLRAEGVPWGPTFAETAAESGQLEILRWAREQGCPWHSERILGAGQLQAAALS
jgi:hypothetical protein